MPVGQYSRAFGNLGLGTIVLWIARGGEPRAPSLLELRGIFFDGEIYIGADGVKKVSTLPTREEAIGQLVGLILSPGANLGGALKGPAGVLAGIIKAIEEKAKAAEPAAA